MTDNVAILDGYTKEIHMAGGEYDLSLLIKPDADLDGSFKAWDMDEQEYIKVNGWLFSIEDQPMRFKLSHGPDGDIRLSRQV
jgi:hypothetical protein